MNIILIQYIHVPPLYNAVENENIDIIKLILNKEGADVNCKNIFIKVYLIKFKNKYFNYIKIQIVQLH